ncbi:MAG: type II toxin-antitoxin system PrlF family antitoxin [Rhizobiales bacterium]|nr:type II toxin-antitoxin system PrlF family antitoxin [Hyphomicrobiales bacterium]
MEAIFTSKITSKGQTTIPIEVREFLKLKPGDRLRYIRSDNAVELRAKTGRASDLAGMFHDPHRPAKSVEEMDRDMAEAIADHTLGPK